MEPRLNHLSPKNTLPEANLDRVEWYLKNHSHDLFDQYWKQHFRSQIPEAVFEKNKPLWIEIGAGSGDYFLSLAHKMPNTHFVPIERGRMRAKTLLKRAQRSGLNNITAIRGNAVPQVIHGLPDESVDRLYILYPCPWPKNSHRKHRWYLHPMMRHLVRSLKKGGLLIWASDQGFYIEEAHHVCQNFYPLKVLGYGKLTPNAYNHLECYPGGRSKFEGDFFKASRICHELIVEKC